MGVPDNSCLEWGTGQTEPIGLLTKRGGGLPSELVRGCALSGRLAACLVKLSHSPSLTLAPSSTILYPSRFRGKQLAPEGLMKTL